MFRPSAAALVAALAVLAACDAPAPRVDTAGEAARKTMDEATARLSECVDREAAAQPVAGQPAGAVAATVMAACRAERAVLVERVQEFRVLGHPNEEAERRRVVAETSVAAIETTLRQQAVTAIITRQMGLGQGQPPAPVAGTPAAPAPAAPAQ